MLSIFTPLEEWGINSNMSRNKHNAFVRVLIIFSTDMYISLKKVIEGIVRRFRFSLSFKIGLRYLRWLFITLLLSTLLISGGLCFMLLKAEWDVSKNNADIIVENVKKTNITDIGNYYAQILKNQQILYILNDKNQEIGIIGKGSPGSYINNNEFRKYIKINMIDSRVYLVNTSYIDINTNGYWLVFNVDVTQKLYFVLNFLWITLAAQGFAMFVTFIRGLKTNRQVLKPIERMTRTAQKISGTNLNLRINVKGIQDELKDLAQTINEMMDRIESSYQSQQEFVADASHELRTPIAVISGYANLLERWGKEDEKVLNESIGAIKNEAQNMNELVEKLLFLARNDRKSLVMQKEDFKLSEILQELVRETTLIDEEHEILSNISCEIIINGDRNRLKQALRIFIDNAAKYTPSGGTITIKLESEDSRVLISIIDTGIGISGEDIKNIFDRFYRSDKSRNKEKGGHGLGLAIAKIIILAHNGKIHVRSKEKEGTEFKISLPL